MGRSQQLDHEPELTAALSFHYEYEYEKAEVKTTVVKKTVSFNTIVQDDGKGYPEPEWYQDPEVLIGLSVMVGTVAAATLVAMVDTELPMEALVVVPLVALTSNLTPLQLSSMLSFPSKAQAHTQ